MPSALEQLDLWSLVQGAPSIDPSELLEAIERQVQCGGVQLDFRTRLLIRDSVNALAAHWGEANEPLRRLSPAALPIVQSIFAGNLGTAGFPSLERRLMERSDPDQFRQFLRELGTAVEEPSRLDIGGSGALILAGYLRRATEDIDAVDEVPASLRLRHELLDSLAKRYGLRLAHFQSHYLPAGWRDRLHSLGRFGSIDVFLVDVTDIFVSKLFSNREKDLDDLRMLAPSLDKPALAERLRKDARSLIDQPKLRENAERNWYILYGDALPAP